MKKLILIILCMFISITCGTYRKSTSWKNIGTDGGMYEIVDDTLDVAAFNAFCKKDTLASNLENWVRFNYYDSEQKQVNQWFYIKNTDTNTFYILTKITDSTYRLSVRHIK